MIEQTNIKIGNKESKVIRYTMLLDEGVWYKFEYDSEGNETYYEDYNYEWHEKKYDDRGNIIYFESSRYGILRDDRKN